MILNASPPWKISKIIALRTKCLLEVNLQLKKDEMNATCFRIHLFTAFWDVICENNANIAADVACLLQKGLIDILCFTPFLTPMSEARRD